AAEATACPEPELLKRMRDLAAKLARAAAARREVAMEDVHDFLETGNAWLEALGYGANSPPTGRLIARRRCPAPRRTGRCPSRPAPPPPSTSRRSPRAHED